jgi:hypothetical protein
MARTRPCASLMAPRVQSVVDHSFAGSRGIRRIFVIFAAELEIAFRNPFQL